MNNTVCVTCAVTGGADSWHKHPGVPVTPSEIAAAAIQAAKAGAAIVHIHARDPETKRNSRNVGLFKEIVRLIKESGEDVIINLTGGNGGSWTPSLDQPLLVGTGEVVGPAERLDHIREIRPDICTLDCGALNFGESVYINTPRYLSLMAAELKNLGIRAELEVFDLGHVRIANQLVADGLIGGRPLYQLCLDVPWGAPANIKSILAMLDLLPANAIWAAFGISRAQMPMVAQAVLLGGHVRVGLEDNLYLGPKRLATNKELVEQAVRIIEVLGARVMTPAEARQMLGLAPRA